MGIPELDQQHGRILDLLQRAQDELRRHGSGWQGAASALTELRGLVMFHFMFEEIHLRGSNFHGADPRAAGSCDVSHRHLADHLRDHADFLASLNDLFSSSGANADERLHAALPELDHWIRKHIITFDVPGLAGDPSRLEPTRYM